MLRKNVFSAFGSISLLALATLVASAQTGELRGHVVIKQMDGQKAPASEAMIDVYRTDLPGKYNTKANKKGEFVFAGLPYVGTYIIAGSHPSGQPNWIPNIKVGRDIDYELELSPGDGKRLTLDDIKAAQPSAAAAGNSPSANAKVSSDDKAKRAELEKKNAEILEKNKKIEEANAIVGRTFKEGNEALKAKKYDESIKLYEEGLAADPEQSALLTNKALALKARGVDRYNAAITATDEAAKKSGLEAAQADFRAAADATAKAMEVLKSQPNPTDPAEVARYNANKMATLSARAEAMRLFVTKVDQSQVEAGQNAYQDYITAETDPAVKAKAQRDLAQMLFDANAFDKALAEYKKILETHPDDPDALVKSGMLLFNIGAMNNNDKVKFQEAANYLQQFVEKAPDTDKLKGDAKAILEELKNQQNVKAEKAAAPARRRRP